MVGVFAGTRIGKVELVEIGGPEAVTVRTEGAADGLPPGRRQAPAERGLNACRWSSSIGVVVMELSPTVIPACSG